MSTCLPSNCYRYCATMKIHTRAWLIGGRNYPWIIKGSYCGTEDEGWDVNLIECRELNNRVSCPVWRPSVVVRLIDIS